MGDTIVNLIVVGMLASFGFGCVLGSILNIKISIKRGEQHEKI